MQTKTREALGVLKRWAYTTPIPPPGPRERRAFRTVRNATEVKLRSDADMELFRTGQQLFIAVPPDRVPAEAYRAARAMTKRAAEALGLRYPPEVRFVAERGTPDWYAAELHWGPRAGLWLVKGPAGTCDGFFDRTAPAGVWIKLGLSAWSTASVVAHEIAHFDQYARLGREAMARADRDELDAEADAFASAMMVGYREEDHS